MRWYTKKEIAVLAGVSENTVASMVERGDLPKNFGPWTNPKRYPADEVDELLGIL